MKKLVLYSLILFVASHWDCSAQYAVNDYKLQAQQALEHAETIAKQAEEIQKMIEQLAKLSEANDIASRTNSILGDYGIKTGLNIQKMGNAYKTFKGLGDVDSIGDATKISRSLREIMGYGDNPKFADVKIDEESAKRYGQVQSTYEAYKSKSESAKTRRAELAEDYQSAMKDAVEATNQADRDMAVQRANVAKAAIEQVDQEVNQAGQDVVVQAALVESENKKEAEALTQKIIEQNVQTTKDIVAQMKEARNKKTIK